MANLGEDGIDMAIGIFLVILVGAAVLPSAFSDWFNASTSSWGSGLASIWPIIPLMAGISLVYLFYQRAGG